MTSKNGSKKTSTTSTILPNPERLSVGETDTGLITIEIQLRKFRLTVIEANGIFRYKLSSLVSKLLEDIADSNEFDDAIRRGMLTEVWAPLSVCTLGECPTFEQFVEMPNVDQAFWINTAKELGHEFRWLDGLNRIYESALDQAETQEREVKKKSRVSQNNSAAEEIVAG